MPKRKDPDIPVRQVAVVTPWPGQSAERVEQLVTRKIEEKIAQNIRVSELKSKSRPGLSVIYAEVDERVPDPAKEFDDIKIKLDSLSDLPDGAGPIQYIKEFGETSALMLTVASPAADGAELGLLAAEIGKRIAPESVSIVVCGSGPLHHSFLAEAAELLSAQMSQHGLGSGLQLVDSCWSAGLRHRIGWQRRSRRFGMNCPSGRIFTRTSGTPSSSCRAVQFARLSS
jgi:hypothetical protein